MALGIITGSGTYALPGMESSGREVVATRFGETEVTRGRFAGQDVLHVSRHRDDHERLSSQVTHQANVVALKELGARAVLAVTVCGATDPTLGLGELVVFDDLHFLANRLADGSLCTLHDRPGAPAAGTGSSRIRSPSRCAQRSWRRRASADTPSATAAATATSTARASTRRPRSAPCAPSA